MMKEPESLYNAILSYSDIPVLMPVAFHFAHPDLQRPIYTTVLNDGCTFYSSGIYKPLEYYKPISRYFR